ncbi:MAG: hypothetical protein R3E79_43940 [Caldilineaceae bacterium]
MSFTSVIEAMPPELQLHMFRFAEALEEKIESDLAVRRQDFTELRVAASELTKAQAQTEQRVGELAEAQKQTEQLAQRQQTLLGRSCGATACGVTNDPSLL